MCLAQVYTEKRIMVILKEIASTSSKAYDSKTGIFRGFGNLLAHFPHFNGACAGTLPSGWYALLGSTEGLLETLIRSYKLHSWLFPFQTICFPAVQHGTLSAEVEPPFKSLCLQITYSECLLSHLSNAPKTFSYSFCSTSWTQWFCSSLSQSLSHPNNNTVQSIS